MGETLRTLDEKNLLSVRALVKDVAERHGYKEYAEDMAQEMVMRLLEGKSQKQKIIHFIYSYLEMHHRTRMGYEQIPTPSEFFDGIPVPPLGPFLFFLADIRKTCSKPRDFEIWFARMFEGKEFLELAKEFGGTKGNLCQKYWRETERVKAYFS